MNDQPVNGQRQVGDRSRRRFLGLLGAVGAGSLLAGCDKLTTSATARHLVGETQSVIRVAQGLVASRESLAREYSPADISPTFRANGSTHPNTAIYRRLAANNFADWRLVVGGRVTRPMKLSLAQLRGMPSQTQITRHDCVEGWSVIGQWTGVRLSHILDAVQPHDSARFVVFHCMDKLNGAPMAYYESLDMVEAHHPQTLLAYKLNGQALPVANGAPLRLRAERQLGYKQAKYIARIDLVDTFDDIQGGQGGYWEDRGYDWWAGI